MIRVKLYLCSLALLTLIHVESNAYPIVAVHYSEFLILFTVIKSGTVHLSNKVCYTVLQKVCYLPSFSLQSHLDCISIKRSRPEKFAA